MSFDNTGKVSFSQNVSSISLPVWTTSTRPASSSGLVGVNTTLDKIEYYNNSWKSLGGGFTRLTTPTKFYTSFTGQPTGTLSASAVFGVPSTAKALLVSGYYHVTGYSTSGHNDHAICIFGGYPSYSSANNWSFTTTSNTWLEFVLYHDGDSSGAPHFFGYWTDGGVMSTNGDTIYYQLGKGYSGGTHYVHVWCFGYWE